MKTLWEHYLPLYTVTELTPTVAILIFSRMITIYCRFLAEFLKNDSILHVQPQVRLNSLVIKNSPPSACLSKQQVFYFVSFLL